jgi:hypothetical protein
MAAEIAPGRTADSAPICPAGSANEPQMKSSFLTATLINDTSSDEHFGCDAVMQAIQRGCDRSGINIICRHPVGVDWRTVTKTQELMRRSDLVLVNGEGSIHHDNARARALAAVGRFCRENNTRSALINASFFKLNKSIDGLRQFDLVFTRDEYSRDIAARAGILATTTGDLSFTHEFDAISGASQGDLCFTDSVKRRVSLVLSDTSKLIGAAYLEIKKNDSSQCFTEYVSRIKGSGMVITGRYHVAVFALTQYSVSSGPV